MRLLLAALAWLVLVGAAGAEPGDRWETADPATVPWAEAATRTVAAFAADHRPTAILVIQGDRVVVAHGDVARRVNLRSVRKSLLGALFGIAAAEHRVALSDTLADLGIDDTSPSLSAAEKAATVGDLLTARSGVYHSAAYETAEMRRRRPARGSHAAGTFWFYNNWDFNALGTIYRAATGEDVFESFARRIARPIGMEDFRPSDGRYVREAASRHPAYVFSMSARDLARFGLLCLQGGRWNGTEVVPATWVAASVATTSRTDRGRLGYGRLWWTLPADPWGPGAFMASGYGGQAAVILPSRRLVVVETVEPSATAKPIHTSAVLGLARAILDAASRD